MGGKGGGSSSTEDVENVMVQVHGDTYRQKIAEEKAADAAAWKAKYGPGSGAHSLYLKLHPNGAADFEDPKPVVAEPEPAAEAPAPAPAAPDPLANMPEAPATDPVLTPPASMGAGDALGGAVLKPPRYWTGGLDQYENVHRTGRGHAGAITTTQT